MSSIPENVRSDTRRAARSLLLPLLTGSEWFDGNLRRDSKAETVLPRPIISAAKVDELIDMVALEGTPRPWLPIPFRITPVISGIHVSLAALANVIGGMRGMPEQAAILDTDHATTSLAGHFAVEIEGMSFGKAMEKDKQDMLALAAKDPKSVSTETHPATMWYLWSQTYLCKDNRYIFLYQKWDPPASLLKTVGLSDFEIPGLLAKCDPIRATTADRKAFCDTLAKQIRENWNSYDLEQHMIKSKVGAVLVPRSRKEFNESPQGKAVGWRPPLEYTRVESKGAGSWAPKPFEPLTEPSKGLLSGIKVVELTRALMGARMGTILGYMGASVVKVNSPDLGEFGMLTAAHNASKLSIHLDLKKEADKETLRDLIRDADVFINNYAWGATDRLGFGPQDLFELVKDRPQGLIYVQANGFGFDGPYATAPAFEHLAQALSGMAWGQGIQHQFHPDTGRYVPAVVPINFLDKATGHMGGLAALVALVRRSTEGGSWLVRTSLVQTAIMLQEFGAYDGLEVVDESKWGEARRNGHWLHTEVWPRYPREDWPADPAGYQFYLGYFMERFMKECHPPSFSDKFFDYYKGAPFGDSKILKPPLWRGFSRTPMTYRIPPRDIGYDVGVTDWKVAEERMAQAEREMKKMDFEKLNAKF